MYKFICALCALFVGLAQYKLTASILMSMLWVVLTYVGMMTAGLVLSFVAIFMMALIGVIIDRVTNSKPKRKLP